MIQFNNLEDFKKYAKEKLQETDFAVLPDVNLVNKNEFIGYRQVLRNAYLNNNVNFCFIDPPTPIWGGTSISYSNNSNQPNTDLPTE
jgi:hypothetical protein